MSVKSYIENYRSNLDIVVKHETFLEANSYDSVWEAAYEANGQEAPEFETLTTISIYLAGYGIEFGVSGPDQKRLATELRRELGGKWDKRDAGSQFRLSRVRDEDGGMITISMSRDAVCEKKVVGFKDVVVPAVEAQPEKVVTEEIVEWECGTLLADEVA